MARATLLDEIPRPRGRPVRHGGEALRRGLASRLKKFTFFQYPRSGGRVYDPAMLILPVVLSAIIRGADGDLTFSPPPLAFGSPIVVQPSGSGAGEPTLQVGSDGTMWLTDLFQIRRSIDHGATWLSIAPPLSRGGAAMDAAQADRGRVHAVDRDRE